MIRRAFTFLSAISLVLCLATSVLWVRSSRIEDWWSRTLADDAGRYAGRQSLQVAGGAAHFDQWLLDTPEPARDAVDTALRHDVIQLRPPGWRFRLVLTGSTATPTSRFLGSAWGRSRDVEWMSPGGWHEVTYDDLLSADSISPSASDFLRTPAPGTAQALVLPLWWPGLLFALLPAAWVASRVRRRSLPTPGLCQTCRYDLRATPGRCPECGAAQALAPAAR